MQFGRGVFGIFAMRYDGRWPVFIAPPCRCYTQMCCHDRVLQMVSRTETIVNTLPITGVKALVLHGAVTLDVCSVALIGLTTDGHWTPSR